MLSIKTDYIFLLHYTHNNTETFGGKYRKMRIVGGNLHNLQFYYSFFNKCYYAIKNKEKCKECVQLKRKIK